MKWLIHPIKTLTEWGLKSWLLGIVNKVLDKYADNSAAPTPPEGKVAVADGYALVNGEWVAQYRFEDAPPLPPRRFSKLRLYAALSKAGLWDALKSWLEAQTYEGMNAWTAVSLAQELTEDHPMFAKWFSAAKSALGITDADAEAILSASVAE